MQNREISKEHLRECCYLSSQKAGPCPVDGTGIDGTGYLAGKLETAQFEHLVMANQAKQNRHQCTKALF